MALLLLLSALWWQFGPRPYELVYRGHQFEYLEPEGRSNNRSALLRLWVGYKGRRPRWWGQKVDSRIEDGHEWSFSNGINIKGGQGIPAMAQFDPEKDCYRYDLEKGLTAYRIENGEAVAVADGLATRCQLTVRFPDPQKSYSEEPYQIPMTLELKAGQAVFQE